jgi:two-component SAPR family response regulator
VPRTRSRPQRRINAATECRRRFLEHAHDHVAVSAFEREAVDYLLKPLTSDRLRQAVARLRSHLAQRAAAQ